MSETRRSRPNPGKGGLDLCMSGCHISVISTTLCSKNAPFPPAANNMRRSHLTIFLPEKTGDVIYSVVRRPLRSYRRYSMTDDSEVQLRFFDED
jgi:hypothetical protein